jgi:hypothetical protein
LVLFPTPKAVRRGNTNKKKIDVLLSALNDISRYFPGELPATAGMANAGIEAYQKINTYPSEED